MLKAVLLDWAGTLVDYGCMAPTAVFMEMFAARGVPISAAEARGPMGLFKRDHIRAVAGLPRVTDDWTALYGQPPSEADIDAMYQDFIPRQIQAIEQHRDIIPGVPEAIAAFRERGLRIGSCTGYTRPMMTPLIAALTEAGCMPDALVCPDEVRAGRPAPWMAYRNAELLDVFPMAVMVKIGDTVSDIHEGRNAGTWTIGLAKSGNTLGLTEAEIAAADPATLSEHLTSARALLHGAGAHYVVDSLADVPPVLDAIELRLEAGERP